MHRTDFCFYGVRTRVVVPSAKDADHLLYYYGDHPRAPGPANLTITLRSSNGAPFFTSLRDAHVEKQIWTDTGHGPTLYESFTLGATRRTPLPPVGFAGVGPDLYMYHGAALLTAQGAAIIRGDSGTGKSALLLALLAETGAAFVSDDILVIDPRGQIWPIYRPVGVRDIILDRLAPRQRAAALDARPISTVTGTTYMVRPAALTALAPMQGHPVTLDIRLSRSPGFTCSARQIGRLMRLEIAYDPDTAFARAAEKVACLLEPSNCPCP